MKKRMIAWLLVISILIPMVFVSSVYAAEPDTYMVPSYRLYQNFMEDSFPDAFNQRLYFATLDACSDLNNLIDKASWVIGEDLTVERCTEILANMVTLMNYQLEDAIVEQAKVDTTKTLLDYGVDIAGIAAGAIGTDTLKKGCDSVMKKITTAIGITNGALDFTASTIEDLELLVQLEGDYSMQYNFLETVYMYADIPEMKEAAQSLILANKEIMRYKLETITSVGESFAKFEATDVFLDQVAEKLLEDPDFWDSDAYGPLMVLSAVYSKFSLFKLTLDIGLFLGDSLFGTSDIYNRYNEMTALCDIHNALLARVKANPALNEEDYENMDRNISLMKMVLYVDARGEYCAYQMTTEGKLSELFSSANNENIEKNYNTSIDIIENTFASLDGLYVEEEWDSNTSDISVSSYLPVIEAAISETAYDSATGSGFLYDLDSDGVDELVILNVYAEVGGNSFPGHAYSVYDIENGEVIAKCDKELLFYDAGGPSGYVGVVNYLGNTALVVYIDNGETGYQAHRETLYTIYDPSSLQVIASASLDYVSADTVQVNNCTVNGKTCSYNDYLSVVDAIEPIIIADIYSNDESDGSMGLYELLRSIQEVCGITPDQSPQITKADAEQIANSVWDEYLKREQGFDWKVFAEDSLIKDGIEYYCFTLQTNSKYGATDWSVFYYLFVNSVTGEYSNSLYDGSSQVYTDGSSETEPVESTPGIASDTITEQELLGEWVIDTEYTKEFNEMSMWDFYGTSFSDGGNKMIFGSDGSYKYYVAWCYGNGTFELQNGEITVNLTDGDPIQGAIKLLVMNDGVTRIALDQYGDGNLIFWIKS